MLSPKAVLFVVLVIAVGCPPSLLADSVKYGVNHATDGDLTDEISASPGDTIEFTITDTCQKFFNYKIKALEQRADDANTERAMDCNAQNAEALLAQANYCVFDTKVINFTHSSQTSAYLIEVQSKRVFGKTEDEPPKGVPESLLTEFVGTHDCKFTPEWKKKAKPLPDRVYTVSTQSTWAIGMSGGLTVSSVTDRRFAVVNDPMSMTDPPSMIVVRDRGAEDSNSLGFAGFVHVHNRNWRARDISIAPTFGLGIGDSNSLSGFAGVGFGAKDIGYVNVGWHWRQVDRLPAGQQVGAPPINDNVLSDLPDRVDDGWFIGFSFRFMSPGESFFSGKTVTPDANSSP